MTSMERPVSVLELLELATTALRNGTPPPQAIAVHVEEARLVLEVKVADAGQALRWVAELPAVDRWDEGSCNVLGKPLWWWHGKWRSAVVQIHTTERTHINASEQQ